MRKLRTEIQDVYWQWETEEDGGKYKEKMACVGNPYS